MPFISRVSLLSLALCVSCADDATRSDDVSSQVDASVHATDGSSTRSGPREIPPSDAPSIAPTTAHRVTRIPQVPAQVGAGNPTGRPERGAEEPVVPPPSNVLPIEGQGAMRAVAQSGVDLGAFGLRHTSVSIEVSGAIARARVTQTFVNPTSSRVEAIYTYPLPEDAAVRDFEMRIGDRVVRSVIREKQAAREEYERARGNGQTASLLEQERPNIFTQSVANIPANGEVQVTLEYVEVLAYEAGNYELSFPMTVGPRYTPGSARAPAQPAYATGNMRAGHDIDVSVSVEAGVPLLGLESETHELVTHVSGTHARTRIAAHDQIPNRDFVLRYRVAPQGVASGMIATKTGDSGHFSLIMHPSIAPAPADVRPRELIFVLDTSGSMSGEPLDKCRALMDRALSMLRPQDAFNVLTFDDQVSTLSATPLQATPANIARGRAFAATLVSNGGTNMMNGIRAAISMPHDPSRLKVVAFLTDGYVGDDDQILGEIDRTIGDARLFSFGIGSSVNRYLLDGMAERGRGSVQYVHIGGNARLPSASTHENDVVARFSARLDKPVLTDVEIDWGGLDVTDLSVERLPDLFAGQPLVVLVRYAQGGNAVVHLRGKIGTRPFEQSLRVSLPESEPNHVAIASIWARGKIATAMREMDRQGETEALKRTVLDLGLSYRLLTKYTSFVAIEERVSANPNAPLQTVQVPAELPVGVNAESIFGPGVTLSLSRFQPGDPELQIIAPPGTLAVSVVFPFGETKAAEFEPRLERWTTRFLVPRSTPDGLYEVVIVMTGQNGFITRYRTSYTVDSQAPDVDISVMPLELSGSLIIVNQRATASDATAMDGAGPVAVTFLPDISHVSVRMPDGSVVELEQTEPGRFEGTWVPTTDLDGHWRVAVTSTDIAGNQKTTNHLWEEIETMCPL